MVFERRTDFIYRDGPEPHAARKMAILEKHPDIKSLMVHEPRTKYLVFATVVLQVGSQPSAMSVSVAPLLILSPFAAGVPGKCDQDMVVAVVPRSVVHCRRYCQSLSFPGNS